MKWFRSGRRLLLLAAALSACAGAEATPTPTPIEPYPVGSCVTVSGPDDDPNVFPGACAKDLYRVESIKPVIHDAGGSASAQSRADCPPRTDAVYFSGSQRDGAKIIFGTTYCLRVVE